MYVVVIIIFFSNIFHRKIMKEYFRQQAFVDDFVVSIVLCAEHLTNEFHPVCFLCNPKPAGTRIAPNERDPGIRYEGGFS